MEMKKTTILTASRAAAGPGECSRMVMIVLL